MIYKIFLMWFVMAKKSGRFYFLFTNLIFFFFNYRIMSVLITRTMESSTLLVAQHSILPRLKSFARMILFFPPRPFNFELIFFSSFIFLTDVTISPTLAYKAVFLMTMTMMMTTMTMTMTMTMTLTCQFFHPDPHPPHSFPPLLSSPLSSWLSFSIDYIFRQ